jgi:hypothetical protein
MVHVVKFQGFVHKYLLYSKDFGFCRIPKWALANLLELDFLSCQSKILFSIKLIFSKELEPYKYTSTKPKLFSFVGFHFFLGYGKN